MHRFALVSVLAGALLLSSCAGLGPAARDTSRVADEDLRPLSTDRPNATESPITVDRGRFLVETSIADVSLDADAAGRSQRVSVLQTNLKMGLTESSDLQLVFTPYAAQSTRPNGGGRNLNGSIPPPQIRYKHNLWGNDGGDSAAAILPFVTLPTGGPFGIDRMEGGVVGTASRVLSDRLGLGGQLGLGAVWDPADDDYDLVGNHTVVLNVAWTDRLAGYYEYLGTFGTESGVDYLPHASTGFTYLWSQNVQFDLGTVLGLTADANDRQFLGGFSIRF